MNRTIKITGGLALITSMLVLGMLVTVWTAQAQDSIQDWPALTLRYEVSGQYYAVGQEKAPTTTKEIILTYRGLNDWRREVISATTVEVSDDYSFSEAGSYIEVKNGVLTDYSTITGETNTEDVAEDTYMSPESRLAPLPFEKMVEKYDGDPVKVETDVRLCWGTTCHEKAQGWAFGTGEQTYVYVEDKRGIPLALPGLTITEVNITGDPEPVEW